MTIPPLSAKEAVAIAWTVLSPDYYVQRVFERDWSPDRYHEWVGHALADLVLIPTLGKVRANDAEAVLTPRHLMHLAEE
jgi:hypothetical protein